MVAVAVIGSYMVSFGFSSGPGVYADLASVAIWVSGESV